VTSGLFIVEEGVVVFAELVFEPVDLLAEEERAAGQLLELDCNLVLVDLGNFDFHVDVAALAGVFLGAGACFARPLEDKFRLFGRGSELGIRISQRFLEKLE